MKVELFAVAVFCAVLVRGYPTQLDNGEDEGWDEISMFGNGTKADWQLPLTPLSNENISEKVAYYLYTKDTPNDPLMSQLSDRILFNGHLDVSKPVKILIHGYLSNKDKAFARTVREAYLKKGSYNVINVDWSGLARGVYPRVKGYVPEVGRTVADFIERLASQTGLRVEQMHVLGHSLGAHVSGVAGLNVKSGKLMRITGLDPAGPMYSCSDTERLQPTSARFVDVIHTCGGGLGFYGSLGHVDFYPNHGKPNQPGCTMTLGTCSHRRAAQYYAESLTTPEGFQATKCEHWKNYLKGDCDGNPTTFMGEFVSNEARGDYWLSTNGAPPFALGHSIDYSKHTNTSFTNHTSMGNSSHAHTNDAFRINAFNLPSAILMAVGLFRAVLEN